MSKRKLNRRQAWRINKIQQERSDRLHKKAGDEESSVSGRLGPEQQGLVISHFGTQVEVANSDDHSLRQRCHLRANVSNVVTGDRVVFQPAIDGGIGVVSARMERESVLWRPDSLSATRNIQLKPVAANIDLMIIVFAASPKPSAMVLDHYLVAAHQCGIRPCLLLNKADLAANNSDEMLQLLEIYQGLDYPLIRASCETEEGFLQLNNLAENHTSVLVGQSGVGKSSLINVLLPDQKAQLTKVVSDKSDLGQHTTTTARWFDLPEPFSSGAIIDSPGIREFGLWHINRKQLIDGYPDIAPFTERCKFRDCSHQHEPGCAVLQAAERHQIHPTRLQNFLNLLNDLRTN